MWRRPGSAAAACAFVAAGALAAALCAGCAEEGSGGRRQLPASTIESFRLLMYQPRDLALAEHRLTQRCMRAKGFQYPAKVPDTGRAAGSLLQIPPPFTVEQARVEGYGKLVRREPGARSPGTANPVDRYVASLTPAERARFRRALDDESAGKVTVSLAGGGRVAAASGGCRGEARLKTYGSVENFLTVIYLPQMAQTQVLKLESDRMLRRAMTQYARCMSRSGYPVDTPTAAVELAESYYATGASAAARQREITLATRDASCQDRANIFRVYQDAVNRVAAAWIAEHEAAVLAAADAQRSALENARKVLRDGP